MDTRSSSSVEEALEELRAGRLLVVLDDEDRENEGDLVCAAEFVTAETINFMATHARGLICMPMDAGRLDELEIPLMVERNTAKRRTAFCVSIGAKRNVTTGISAADRARTIRLAVDPDREVLLQERHDPALDLLLLIGRDDVLPLEAEVDPLLQVVRADDDFLAHLERFHVDEAGHRRLVLAPQRALGERGIPGIVPVQLSREAG